jgi:hypothetical protein
MSVRRVVFASLFVLLLALSACSKDPVKPAPFTPGPTVSESSPTASPTGPAEPTMPAAAEGDGRAAAKAFVGYYVKLINYAQQTGSVDTLDGFSASECVACDGVIEGIDKTYKAGGRIQGGLWNIRTWGTAVPRVGSDFAFAIVVWNDDQTVTHGDGSSRHFSGGNTTYLIEAARRGKEWITTWLEPVD